MYEVLRVVFRAVFKIFFRCRVSGQEQIPKTGGVIVAANHMSLWDPPLVAAYVPRATHFMAKEELFHIPVFNSLIRSLHAFPVRRGAADRGAIRTAIQLLKDGECLGLFPEGTRSKNGDVGRAEPGLALIAVKSGVPVVPAAVVGTDCFLSKGRLFPTFEVRYGKPISFAADQADKAQLQAFSQKIMDEIKALKDG